MSFGLRPRDDVEIRTPRLVLRPLTFADVPALFDAIDASRQFLERWLPWAEAVRAHGDLRVFIDRCQRRNAEGEAHRGIFEPDGRLAGHISLEDAVPARRAAELGYWVRQDRAGRGFTTEAARALLAWGFRNLDLHRVTAYADV
ncbi:MAG: GNAT family N-acetyltransferase, partial [Planctomycetes bacterium]|nr:GNAT family N-acetyltransferase [Planctomycetota bacterium]